jgi:hypothetical protein
MSRALQEIASGGTTGMATRYGETQRGALSKLAQFQQDQAKAGKILSEKDKSAFGMSDKDFDELASIKGQKAKILEEQSTAKKNQERYTNFGNEYRKILEQTSKIPHARRDLRQQIEDQAFEQLGAKFGFNPDEINTLARSVQTKGQAADLLFQKANEIGQSSIEKQKAREKSQMSLQDYINKTYEIS